MTSNLAQLSEPIRVSAKTSHGLRYSLMLLAKHAKINQASYARFEVIWDGADKGSAA